MSEKQVEQTFDDMDTPEESAAVDAAAAKYFARQKDKTNERNATATSAEKN